jgi:glycosyltransferase involved in cell wall biosynthesis
MRVLIYGTSPLVGSGYASAVRYVSKGLRARGHETFVFAWNSHAGPVIKMDDVPIYPRSNCINGADGLGLFAKHCEADLILAICDPWVMSAEQWRGGHDCPVVFWYPCQSEPASSTLVQITTSGDLALCYSQWGTEAMRAAGGVNTHYCPLGVDTGTFRPLDRAACRNRLSELLGFDLGSRFVVGMVAANSSTVPTSRKAFDQTFLGFRRYLDLSNDPDAILYVHTWPGPHQGGYELRPMLESIGISDRVYFPDPAWYLLGLPDSLMAKIYGAFDVACQTTTAEGFGLPILEAQACGVPVLSTHYSSMPELTAHGYTVAPAAKLWAPQPMDGWVALPDPQQIGMHLDAVRHGELVTTADEGLALARSLSWDRVIDSFLLPQLTTVYHSRAAIAQGGFDGDCG